MSTRVIIYPHKMSSGGAKALAKHFGTKKVYPDRNYVPEKGDLVINWGNSTIPTWYTESLLNQPVSISKAVNKVDCLSRLRDHGVSVPAFYLERVDAYTYMHQVGIPVVARTKVASSSGKGIIMVPNDEPLSYDDFPDAPLYTRYIPPEYECRVHVFNNKVIDYAQKKKRNGVEADPYVRSYKNGWVFCREGVVLGQEVLKLAVQALDALGLHFGAVDIVVGKDGNPYVLEVNTAPGLQGTTLSSYINAIEEYANA